MNVKLIIRKTLVLLMLSISALHARDDHVNKGLDLDPVLIYYLDQGLKIELGISKQAERAAPTGPFRVRTVDGAIILEGTFHEGRFDSDLKTFSPAGALLSIERYRKGVRYGTRVEWDSKGMVTRITPHSESGNKHGVERHFSKSKIVLEVSWHEGSPTEIKKYSESGDVEVLQGEQMWREIRMHALDAARRDG